MIECAAINPHGMSDTHCVHSFKICRLYYGLVSKLKSIDQATQLERFERLRAAYACALAQIEDHASDPFPRGPAPADSPGSSTGPQPPATAEHGHAQDAPQAFDVETAYAQFLAQAGNCTTRQLTDRLVKLLDDLTNLETREELELVVLNDVFTPRPFRESLMTAAAEAFHWDESLHHLADRSLEAAREMHAWVAERALLQSIAALKRQQMEAALAWARDYFHMRYRAVSPAKEALIAQTVRDMQDSFPTVVRYGLDDEIVDYWLRRPDLNPAALRDAPRRGPGTIASSAWGLATLVLVFGALIFALNYSSGRAPYSVPSLDVANPARSFQSRCRDLLALDSERALLTSDQWRELKLCRDALHDTLYGPERSKLGLKPPQSLDDTTRRAEGIAWHGASLRYRLLLL
jgi:hypothetical protein